MVNIDNVYQKVLAIANKEQRGYITPQEFNLMADKAQLEIFDNYFHGFKTATKKPSDQMLYADEVEMLEEKLHPFHTDDSSDVAGSELVFTTTPYKIISITRANGTKVTQLNKSQVQYTESSPLTKATLKRSVFVREDNNRVTIYPAASSETWDVDTSNPADGVLDAERFEVSYYSRLDSPIWGYIVSAQEKALYNPSTSTNFNLHASEEENLVTRILMLAGVIIQKPEIQQSGIQDMQLLKQQQNS
jgi:hypothetical protein